jgi:transcriptional regulator with XRE-family HTH domain
MNGSVNLADLGRRVRAARLARRLTLEEVVSRADFTVSWLSKVENGQLTPSLEGLVKLADVLECGVDDLVEGLSTPPRHVVVKGGHGRAETVRSAKSPTTIEHLADQWRGRAMQPTIIHLGGASRPAVMDSHDGERFLFVLEGDVRFEYGDEVIMLGPGDSIYVDATIPHGLSSRGKGKARILSVAHEPHALRSRDRAAQRNGLAKTVRPRDRR